MAYTKHGWYIPNTDETGGPPVRANCGGVLHCEACAQDCASYILSGGDVTGPDHMREAGRNRTLPNSEVIHRFGYHAGTEKTGPQHAALRRKFIAMCIFLDELVPPGRAKNVMFTELEAAAMWGNKAIAEQAPVITEAP